MTPKIIYKICPHCGKANKTIAVDFDGVIHKYSKGYFDGTLYDPPIDGAEEALAKLVERGYQVVIFTARLHPMFGKLDEILSAIVVWLQQYGIQEGTHYHLISNHKPPALCYIDDSAIRFTNWKDIQNYF